MSSRRQDGAGRQSLGACLTPAPPSHPCWSGNGRARRGRDSLGPLGRRRLLFQTAAAGLFIPRSCCWSLRLALGAGWGQPACSRPHLMVSEGGWAGDPGTGWARWEWGKQNGRAAVGTGSQEQWPLPRGARTGAQRAEETAGPGSPVPQARRCLTPGDCTGGWSLGGAASGRSWQAAAGSTRQGEAPAPQGRADGARTAADWCRSWMQGPEEPPRCQEGAHRAPQGPL